MNFECCLTTACTHNSIDAIRLPCEHYVCKSCLKLFDNLNQFSCKFCGVIYEVDNLNLGELNENIDLFRIFSSVFNEYKCILNKLEGLDGTLDGHFEYVFDEIDVRIESLKGELDNLRDSIRNELVLLQSNLKSKVIHKRVEFKNEFTELENILTDKSKQSFQTLNEFQKQINEAYKLIEATNQEAAFKFNETPLNQTIIGSHMTSSALKQIIETKQYEAFELDKDLEDLVILPNNRLILIFHDRLKLYDNHLALLNVYNTKFEPFQNEPEADTSNSDELISMAITNGKNRIYFIHPLNEKISMTDLDLSCLKTFGKLDKGFCPTSIEYFKSFIYIGHYNRLDKGVLKCTEDLELVHSYKLSDVPYTIKATANGIACLEFENDSFGFYAIEKDFQLLYKYNHALFSNITVWNDEFYLFKEDDGFEAAQQCEQKIYCFKNTGEFKSEIDLKKLYHWVSLYSFVEFNGRLFTSLLFSNDGE